jgi:hypothetical protein
MFGQNVVQSEEASGVVFLIFVMDKVQAVKKQLLDLAYLRL